MPAEALDPRAGDVVIETVALDSVLPLRARMLRAGRPVDVARSPKDDAPQTQHLAAKTTDGRVVGVVTLVPRETPFARGRRAVQVRGMAVDEAVQRRRIGRLLMREAVRCARERDAEVVWANARDTALQFYERVGFRVVGDGFVDDVMQLGHHVVLAGVDDIDA
ncbi:MAG: GNAT family N-acetyltransferase [Candidatus Dormibacteraeota bacterium]|nr:GNAT family N-acetyltransferase [Candidatus Dormibacteraeota bacterium]